MPRNLAIGDIHGCATALDALLQAVGLRDDDVVVTLGDYVDRGPDSKGVIDRLLELDRTHRLVALRGNHEIMMVGARDDPAADGWLDVGGDAALLSYGGGLNDVPETHWRFIEGLRPYFETDGHFFVHANAFPDMPLAEQPDFMRYWEFLAEAVVPHESGKTMVCGHTSQKSGLPRNLGHAVCIDTWACGRGWLTCLHVESGRIWQAKQSGETRTLWLDEA